LAYGEDRDGAALELGARHLVGDSAGVGDLCGAALSWGTALELRTKQRAAEDGGWSSAWQDEVVGAARWPGGSARRDEVAGSGGGVGAAPCRRYEEAAAAGGMQRGGGKKFLGLPLRYGARHTAP